MKKYFFSCFFLKDFIFWVMKYTCKQSLSTESSTRFTPSYRLTWNKTRNIYSDFARLRLFATLNSRDILIFIFLRHLIPATFCLKVAKNFSRFSQNFLSVTFSSFEVSCTFIHKTFTWCSKQHANFYIYIYIYVYIYYIIYIKYVMCCAIWYYLYNLKIVKNTQRGVLLLVKLQTKSCSFNKSNTFPWVFFTFFRLHKWSQIVQSVSYTFNLFYVFTGIIALKLKLPNRIYLIEFIE